MRIADQLINIGLNQSEVKAYLYLLQQGLSTASQVGVGSGIGRTNSYHVIRSLSVKKLLREEERRGKIYYAASDPGALLHSLDQKREVISNLLPDLKALYKSQKNKPKVRFYSGWDEVKEIYLQILESESLNAIGSTRELLAIDEKFFIDFQRQLKAGGVVCRDIVSQGSNDSSIEQIKSNLGALYDVRVLSDNYSDVPTDTLMWDDNVALVTLQEPIYGTVITNPLIAKSFKIQFNLIWDSLEG